jgi:PAS domain-containing protein
MPEQNKTSLNRKSPDRIIHVFLLAAIVESSDDAMVSKNLNGIVSSWNETESRMFGYTAEEIIG